MSQSPEFEIASSKLYVFTFYGESEGKNLFGFDISRATIFTEKEILSMYEKIGNAKLPMIEMCEQISEHIENNLSKAFEKAFSSYSFKFLTVENKEPSIAYALAQCKSESFDVYNDEDIAQMLFILFKRSKLLNCNQIENHIMNKNDLISRFVVTQKIVINVNVEPSQQPRKTSHPKKRQRLIHPNRVGPSKTYSYSW